MTKSQCHQSHKAWRSLPMRPCSINHWMTGMPRNVGDTVQPELTVSFVCLLIYFCSLEAQNYSLLHVRQAFSLPLNHAPTMNFKKSTASQQ